MAQKTGQDEAEFKSVPETLNLCINNCGVTGNPSTKNMCQNCFTTTTTSSSSAASSILSSSSGVLKFDKSLKSTVVQARMEPDLNLIVDPVVERKIEAAVPEAVVAVKRVVNRCSGCKRKVGLTGFRCRCGDLFCSEHRYSDRHDCSYDYKAAGREAIARENPVVRAAKIVKV